MSIQIAEISQRLQSALDQSYNVADMDTVLQVISTLENIQITKEQLETTRLGKYINHLRRKTANESLARRAKNLLKKWREMVLPSAGATQQQANANTQQSLMPTIAKDSSAALGMQYDGRSVQPPYYNQLKEPAQFQDISSTSLDNSKFPTSDSRRYGRSHDTGSNHAIAPSKLIEMATEPTEDCTQRYSKFHDINKTNLNTNIGRSPATSNFSGKSKETDPYRTLTNNTISHISISALPKIPKIKNSAASQKLSKLTDRSHSPLVNLKETSSPPKFSSIAHDDTNSTHSYDSMQNFKRFPPNQSLSILNGRNQDYGDNNSTAMDNNSNSSSVNIITEMNVPNVSQPSSEHVNNEVVKKKHKKHKKDKKSKKSKQSSPPPADRIPVAGPSILELPDSLSSNSMSLFASTSDSIKDQHVLTNNNAFANSIGTSLPSTSINAAAGSAATSKNALWTHTPTHKSKTASTDDLTFTGKFSTKNDDNIIINIDSSSGSNSPKYRTRSPMLITAPSRSSSPPRMNILPIRPTDYGSRVATDEENSSTQHISLIQQTESSRASPFGECLVQDDLLANDATKGTHAQSIVAASAMEVQQQTGKKRGRKKGSKGVDSRLGSASNSSQSQQAGAPYYDSISFSSLKNKIDSIRGTTKKVKTTKELLAELQNRKAPTSGDDITVPDAQLPPTISFQDDDESAVTNGKHNLASRTATPTSPVLSSISRSERKKSKSAAKDGSMSDNQNTYENQTTAESTQPKSVIDQEISELIAKLPTINKSALRTWKKSQYHDANVCTCKLIEVDGVQMPIGGSECGVQSTVDNSIAKDPSLVNESVPKMLTQCNVLPQSTTPFDQCHQQLSEDQSAFTKPIPQSNFNSTVATSTSISIPIVNPTVTNEHRPPEPPMDPPAKKPAVKSIFDLDYDDDDDDPITFKLNHNNNINLNTKVKLSSSRDSNNDISDDKSCDELFLNENIKKRDENEGENETVSETGTINRSVPFNDSMVAKSNFLSMDQSGQSDDVNRKAIVIDANVIADSAIKTLHEESKALNATVDLNAMALQSRFRIEEDPDCKAKQLYITSKQSITEFHIEKLHTSYIPNINGNWDDAKNDDEVKMPSTDDAITMDGCGNENPSKMQCDHVDDVDEQTAGNKDEIESNAKTKPQQQGEENEKMEETLEDLENEPRITEASCGLYERVVPLCNHLNMDRLPKNLSHINLDFGPNDEVEPHIFIASIQVKKEVITTDEMTSSIDESKDATTENIHQSNADANNEDLVVDDPFATRIPENFSNYDCDNDIDDIECERKSSPELSFAHIDRECETIEPNFDCEPVEQLEMEVDDIVINNDDIKSDNDLCPIDPFVEPAETKHFDEESDVSFTGSEAIKLSPVIDDNARADADDIEPIHQVIDLNPTQILPATDENAMDSMDFENQLSKPYDMTMINEPEDCKTVRDRFDGSKSNEATDIELEPVGSIPTTDLSDSDDEVVNEVNDDSSLEEDLSFDNYEQEDTSNDHFITLDNFDAALVPSSSEFKQSPSNNSGSSCDEEPNKEAALEGKLFGSMVCDDDDNEMSDSDDIDDDSDTINNLVVPTMFCKPVFIEGGKSSNLLNDNSDSQSDDLSEVKPLEADSSDSNLDAKVVTGDIEIPDKFMGIVKNQEPTVQKLTKDALETHQALSSLNELSNQQKRLRSSSSSSISSTSSSSSSSSTLSPRSKKMKRWMRRRPCPQHYRCASTSSQSSSHSPMSALSPSSMFTNSNAIEPSDSVRMDITEPTAVKDFVRQPDLDEHIDSEFDNGHTQKTISEGVQEQQQMPRDQVEKSDTVMETTTSALPEFVHDELVEDNASLTGNRDDDLLFQQLPLPDQLLQSDGKDGDDDSNSADGIHRNGIIQNQDSIKTENGQELQGQNKEKSEHESSLSSENNGMLPSFNALGVDNVSGVSMNGYKFKEWYEVVHVKSYNDELLTILPYVVID